MRTMVKRTPRRTSKSWFPLLLLLTTAGCQTAPQSEEASQSEALVGSRDRAYSFYQSINVASRPDMDLIYMPTLREMKERIGVDPVRSGERMYRWTFSSSERSRSEFFSVEVVVDEGLDSRVRSGVWSEGY